MHFFVLDDGLMEIGSVRRGHPCQLLRSQLSLRSSSNYGEIYRFDWIMVLWQLPSTVRSLEWIMKIVDFTLYTWASEWEGHLEAILNNFLASNTWFTIAERYIKFLCVQSVGYYNWLGPYSVLGLDSSKKSENTIYRISHVSYFVSITKVDPTLKLHKNFMFSMQK